MNGKASRVRRSLAGAAAIVALVLQAMPAAADCGKGGAASNLDKQDYVRGKRDAPALLAASGVRCEMTNAAFLGGAKVKNAATGKSRGVEIVEVACKDDLGWVFAVAKDQPTETYDCLQARAGGKFACMLPENFMSGGTLDGLLSQAGVGDCHPARAAYKGDIAGKNRRLYEVVCRGGLGGVLLDVSTPRDARSPRAFDCLHEEAAGQCTLATHEHLVARVAMAASRAMVGRCRVSDARMIGILPARKAALYEFACGADQPSVLAEMGAPDGTIRVVACAEAATRYKTDCRLKGSDDVGMQLAAARDPTSAAPSGVRQDLWVRRPTGNAMSRYYPDKALSVGVGGGAMLMCAALVDGSLGDCQVAEESPMGYGFGEATQKLANQFQMRMDVIDASPVVGSIVLIPISFQMAC